MKLHKFSRMAVSLSTAIAFSAVAVAAADGAVYPVRYRAEVTSLNGMWAFEMDGKKGTIQVPGNWETQGWKTPQYGCVVDDKTGIYRRKFQWNPLWKGRRVILRFDGVLFSYEAKVNGKVVGGSGRAFNMSQFDITDVLIEGENEVEVAVRSRTKDDSWLFDTNDCWGICGIFRDVEIFSVPSKAWIADVAFTTKGRSWDARVDVGGPRKSAAKVMTELRGAGEIELWTPQTPKLYDLVVTLELDGEVIQKIVEHVGFRDIETRRDGLYVNGVKIFIKGMNWNEIDPMEGRALSFETFYRNMALMKSIGVNTIRTAHYPFSPRFYEIADSMGFWVIDEVPLASRGRDILKRKEVRDEVIARTAATIRRDRNHPCVLLWSIGNETWMTQNSVEALKCAKSIDPTRPLVVPMIGAQMMEWLPEQEKHFDFGRYVDIYSGHYLSLEQMKKAEGLVDKPIMETEFAHCLKGFGAFEPSLKLMREHPDKWIGGCVWCWRDQALLTDGTTFAGFDVRKKTPWSDGERKGAKEDQGMWLPDGRLYDSWGAAATDGIVYPDLSPKPAFFRVKKEYVEEGRAK